MVLPCKNSNVSRIFQTLGANIDDIPIFCGSMTGLIIQPIIGYFQIDLDKVRRRKPYFGCPLGFSLICNAHPPALWVCSRNALDYGRID
jgi:maltose/moltooligosaccharide transporter